MKKFNLKQIVVLLLIFAMAFSVWGCSKTEPTGTPEGESEQSQEQQPATEGETFEFTDSVGRTVTLPKNLDKVAVSGPLAQIALFALCPDKLVGIASAWDKTAEKFLDTKYYNLPELGQLYGGKGELNLETLLASGAQVVIDVGEPKDSVAEDLDALQKQTGIPFVHITAKTENTGDAYRKLGELLGMKDEAEKIAKYCDDTYAKMKTLSESVEKVNVLYCTGDAGLNVIAKGSFHAEIIDMMANNVAEVAEPSSKGTGNEVDMEQLLTWDPDVILFSPESAYATVGSDAAWSKMKAISTGKYYEVPYGPYNWMGFPPSVQRYLGMLWMAEVLYPEKAGLNMYDEVAAYYEMFYHCQLTKEQYDELVQNSLAEVDNAA